MPGIRGGRGGSFGRMAFGHLSVVFLHSLLQVVLGASNVDFSCDFAFYLVDHQGSPAHIIVLASSRPHSSRSQRLHEEGDS